MARTIAAAATWLVALAVLAGCASTEVTQRESLAGDERLPRPDRIIVYDVGATSSDVRSDSAMAGRYSEHGTPQTAEQVEAGRTLGALMAQELVNEIRNLGLPAVRAAGQPPPRPGDIVISGYLVSAEKGSRGKRLIIGFGSGSSELTTVIEGHQMTPQGLRRLGSREFESGGGKMPGLFAPVAVMAATGNPIGLIVGGGANVAGEATGKETLEGAAKRTAAEAGKEFRAIFQRQGWI